MKLLPAGCLCLLLTMVAAPGIPAGEMPVGKQSGLSKVLPASKQPLVIIYTLSTCSHCREAKDYFTENHVPFVNREVDTDSKYMDDLMAIYDTMKVPDETRGVPLILIGDSIKLQGFDKEKVQDALKKVLQK